MYEPMYVRINTKAFIETGEIIYTSEPMDIDTINGNTGLAPKGSFEILRKRPFCDMLNESGSAYCRVLSVLLDKKTLENCVELSTKQIAERANISRNTAMGIIDKMEASKGIVQGFRKIMLNPYMIHKGDKQRESYLTTKYLEMAREFKKGDYAKKKEAEADEV